MSKLCNDVSVHRITWRDLVWKAGPHWLEQEDQSDHSVSAQSIGQEIRQSSSTMGPSASPHLLQTNILGNKRNIKVDEECFTSVTRIFRLQRCYKRKILTSAWSGTIFGDGENFQTHIQVFNPSFGNSKLMLKLKMHKELWFMDGKLTQVLLTCGWNLNRLFADISDQRHTVCHQAVHWCWHLLHFQWGRKTMCSLAACGMNYCRTF